MAVPVRTREQRQAGLERALAARATRSAMLSRLTRGQLTLAEVLAQAEAGDRVLQRTRLVALLQALPGIGPVRAADLLAAAGVSYKRRVRGLGTRQRRTLLALTSHRGWERPRD